MAVNAPAAMQNETTTATYGGLFTVTLTTLMYEIILTRIFSVTMWYHFAFVAISVALFGMTVGALAVYLRPDRFPDETLPAQLWRYALWFSVSIALTFVVQLAIPFSPKWNLAAVFSVILTCFVISVPFMFSGVVVCLTLTRYPRRVNRLYGADLVGAALGCALMVPLLNTMDGPSAVMAIAALAGGGALLFAMGAGATRGMWLAMSALLALGGFALLNDYRAERGDPILRIIWAKEAPEPVHDYERWNSFSRVTVDGDGNIPQRPLGWGFSSRFPSNLKVHQLLMTIDGVAGTPLTRYDGAPESTDFLRYDVINLAHNIRRDADVLVIGVGGGRDILSAFEYEQKSVTGVEINEQILDTTNGVFGDFTGHLDRDPRVTFVNDEARSYLERTDNEYDIIQISLIDTWAATSAGAYALTENSLYTKEAWHTFFDRLRPGGVLTVSRWYYAGKPLETYRMTALAAEVLAERGVTNPREHLAVYRGEMTPVGATGATLIVSEEPLTASDFAALDAEAERLEFTAVLTPTYAVDGTFALLASPGGVGEAIDRVDEDISPPTDDRPFFFLVVDFETFLNGSAFQDTFVVRPALVLGVLALAVLGLTAVFIGVPLAMSAQRSAHKGMLPFYTYFAGIGLGFLLLELSQLQRLSVFLGQPTYALTVVLFSLLLSSGIGSMLTERFVRANRTVTLIAPLALLLVAIIVFGALTPEVIGSTRGETTPVRIAVAVGLLMPLGLVMGMPFPIGMSVAASRPGAPTAFMWGINGATSVCASVFGMVIALLWGISAAFWAGLGAYVIAVAAMCAIAFLPLRATQASEALALTQEAAP